MWPFRREVKEHPNGAAFLLPSTSRWNRGDRKAYVREGYQTNAVIYRGIREICNAANNCAIELWNGETLIESHPALDLIERPNPMQSWGQLLTETLTDRMLFGEQAIVTSGDNAELWGVRPSQVEIKPGRGGIPAEYVHDLNGHTVRFPVSRIDGTSDMFFTKLYNPDDHWRGQSPLMAAGLAGDTHNAGMKWNYSLLRNSARPSGLIEFPEGDPGANTLDRLREWFKSAFQGSDNAGEIPMLFGGAKWTPMDQSPRDMDFNSTLTEAKQLIASALGVPLPLVDNDASTFNNLEQAKERLYTDTVIPMMEDFLGAFGAWLLPRFGEGLEFRLDLDSIPALEGIRQKNFDRAIAAVAAQLITREEARELIGYTDAPIGEFIQAAPQQQEKALLAKLAYG